MISSVSDLGQSAFIDSLLASTRSKLDQAQTQLSSGYKARTYGELGGADTVRSISLHSQLKRIDAYQNTIAQVDTRVTVQSNVLSNVEQTASKIHASLLGISQYGTPDLTAIQAQAKSALQTIQQQLNTQVAGRYIFAGDDITHAPIADTTAADTSTQAVVANFTAGTATAAQTTAASQSLTSAQLGYSATVGAAGHVNARIDDNVDVDYTVKADQPEFQDLIRNLSLIANLQYTPSNASGFWQVFTSATQGIDQAHTAVVDDQAKLGVVQNQLDTTKASNDTSSNSLTILVGNVEDVDMAEVSTRINGLNSQLQASYSVVSQLKNLSLVDYLK